ncbi:uncharacterized protein NFIA_099200 [Aspergillus fischeri NRRL 181]|uniref:Protein kinase domain-containing protein n=1 Tax=Neosartorya fischeri (strain ATCC 1020 / DSM 3700 / CBS 544.65 / FGSC A1164 / JCM 1740 / NRRL 181 / WB 181) TaxID=331117 RepID=A1DBP6_NEOFI|nr:conserved hypothetical protein [Aspergillus fischeri NRRL 181]EAW20286.1 conserved hypothetical protein [Aspergillus fischeri NRRL 181]
MIQGEFDYHLNLQKSLATCPNVRGVVDTVKDLEMFIYPYLSGDLLRLSQRKLSEDTRRYILRSALQGLMIYVMVNEMVFRVNDDELNSADSWRHILRRHISYFADEDGLNGFLEHIGEENPFYDRLIDLANTFGPENPRQPFERWGYVEADLRDLVGKMANLDPTKRITATEALQHRWFSKTGL